MNVIPLQPHFSNEYSVGQISSNSAYVDTTMESEILSNESGSYEKQIPLCVWNISGLRSKLNEMNDNFKQFILGVTYMISFKSIASWNHLL